MLRIVLTDPSTEIRKQLNDLSQQFSLDIDIESVYRPDQVYLLAENVCIDCFILSLDETNDVWWLIASLRAQPQYMLTPIVLISDRPDFAGMALQKYHCMDYLQRPLRKGAFSYLFQMLKVMNDNSYAQSLNLKLPKSFLRIPVNRLLFIESADRKSLIHTYDSDFQVPLSLQQLSEIGKRLGLIRTHRSYIVNLKLISCIHKDSDPWQVDFLDYDQSALVSRSYFHQVEFSMDCLFNTAFTR